MGIKHTSHKNRGDQEWITQKELAKRWRVSEGTIINLRKKGILPVFSIPGLKKILYPVKEVLRMERENTGKEVQSEQKTLTEFKIKKPVMSARPEKDWRIE